MVKKSLKRRIVDGTEALIIVTSMLLLSALLGMVLFGFEGIIVVSSLTLFLFSSTLLIDPEYTMRIRGGRSIPPEESPLLHRILRNVSAEVGIDDAPSLFLIENPAPAAFTAGKKSRAVIALTDTIIRILSPEEIKSVLAHEMSHIANGDLFVQSLAATVARITSLLSLTGQVLLLLYIPLFLASEMAIPIFPILILVFAPLLSFLLRMSLSRAREFEADQMSASVTGSAAPLISALKKIEAYQRMQSGRLLFRFHEPPIFHYIRSHPSTEERIKRLEADDL